MSNPTSNTQIATWTDDLVAANAYIDELEQLCTDCEHATHRLEREQVEDMDRRTEIQSIDDTFSSNA